MNPTRIIPIIDDSITEKFLERISFVPNSECWKWTGWLTPEGYGMMRGKAEDGSITKIFAHRLSCFIYHGPPPSPDKNRALHSCDYKSCVNPAHLRWGNDSDNRFDFMQRGDLTRFRSNVAFGDRLPQTKLSFSDLQTVRDLLSSGVTQSKIAKQFKVDPSLISRIKSGEIRKRA